MSIYDNFYLGWGLYNLICMVLMLIMWKQVAKSQKVVFVRCFFCAFLLLALFGNAISPDYLNYREIVKEIASTNNPFVHVEEFYIWLIHHIGNNFYLYQTCIYLPVFLCIYWLCIYGCRVENPVLFLVSFAVFVLYIIIVGRYYLFTTVYLTGIVLLCKRRYVLGIILLSLSFFLHKLAYIGLPLVPLFFLPWKWTKKRVIIVGLLFVSIVLAGRFLIQNYMSDVFDAFSAVPGADYLNKTEGINDGGSLWWQVISGYQAGSQYLLMFFVLYQLRGFCLLPLGSVNRVLYMLILGTTLTSLFIYGLGLPDTTIAGRTFSIGQIPLCYFISLLPQCMRISQVKKRFFFLICFFYLLFNNAYIVGVSHILL